MLATCDENVPLLYDGECLVFAAVVVVVVGSSFIIRWLVVVTLAE